MVSLNQKTKLTSTSVSRIQRTSNGEASPDNHWQPNGYHGYLKECEKTVLRQMIRDSRRKSAMPLDDAGVPLRVYTNQSETCNSMLAARKRALGYTKKEDISKADFVLKVWKGVVDNQDSEVERALYGQSDTFTLNKDAKYLQVSVEE